MPRATKFGMELYLVTQIYTMNYHHYANVFNFDRPKILLSNKRTMMVLYRSPEHICNLYGLSRAGY